MGLLDKIFDAVTDLGNIITAGVVAAVTLLIPGANPLSLSFMQLFGLNLALSASSQALAPTPKMPAIDNSRRVTARQPNATRKLVYGETRIGGTIVFLDSTGDHVDLTGWVAGNKNLHLAIVFAPHEVESFDAIYLNDEEITFTSGTSSSFGSVTSPSKYQDNLLLATVNKGAALLTTPSALANNPRWGANHDLIDQAYVHAVLTSNADAFPNGMPNITALIRGRKILDTRTSTTAYSNNPAMVIRDYLTDSVFGLGADSAEIDETSFNAAANICDENVTLSGGGTEKRYTCNGIVDTANTPKANLEQLLTSMNGHLYYSNGKWRIRAGAYVTPTVTLDEDDLASPMTVQTAVSRQESFNAVKGQFFGADANYFAADYPAVTSSTFESEDNDERRFMNVDLPFTSSPSMAQRIAKQILYKNRQEVIVSASFKLSAFQFEVGDTLMLTNSRLGFSSKVFEVVSWKLNFTQERVVVDCVLAETASSVYDWSAEESAFQQDNTVLPSGVAPPAPTNLTLTATAVVNDDGITIPAIRATWDEVTTGFVQYYEIQYKRLGGEEDYGQITVSATDTEDFGSIATTHTDDEDWGLTSEVVLTPDADYQSVLGTSNSFTIIPVLNGYDYNVRIRSINTFGARSSFATSTLASSGDTTPPSTPSNLGADGLYRSIEIEWTNPDDQDLDYVEIWENTSDNLATASQIGTSGSSNFIRGNLANNVTRYYWIRAVDLSLNKSAFTSSVNATTRLVIADDLDDTVNDLFAEAGAFGVEPVNSLPSSGDFDGQLVLLKSDVTIYRWDSSTSAWSTELFTASSVDPGSITADSFASGIEPVSLVSSLPSPTGYTGASVLFNTSDNKLYRYTGTAFTAAVSTQDLSGELGAGLFSDTLRPIERVAALPSTDLTQGRVVMLTTDNKLYRYTGNEWTSDIAAADIDGQLAGSQIADDAITETKIDDNSISSPKMQANSVAADAIQTNAVTAAKINAGAVSADKIAANAVTAAKIQADAVEAGKIAAGAINASDLFVDGVIQAGAIGANQIVSDKIASNAILGSKILAGEITADKMNISELSSMTANLGTITAGSITGGNITADTLTTGTLSVDRIGTNSLNGFDKLAADTTGTVKFGQTQVSSPLQAGADVTNFTSALPYQEWPDAFGLGLDLYMPSITNFSFTVPAYSGTRQFAFIVNVEYFGGFSSTSEIACVLKISDDATTDADQTASGDIANAFRFRRSTVAVASGFQFIQSSTLSAGTYYVRVYAITRNFTGTRSTRASVQVVSVF